MALLYSVHLGTRNVVAECLGKLCLIEPDQLLPRLQAALNSPSPLMRTTVVTAMKFTISDQVNYCPVYFCVCFRNYEDQNFCGNINE